MYIYIYIYIYAEPFLLENILLLLMFSDKKSPTCLDVSYCIKNSTW